MGETRLVVPTWSVTRDHGGVLTYMRGLTRGLLETASPERLLFLASNASLEALPHLRDEQVQVLPVPAASGSRMVVEHLVLKRVATSADVVLIPSNVTLGHHGARTIVVVQSSLLVPGLRTNSPRGLARVRGRVRDALIARSVSQADVVVSPSRFVANALQAAFGDTLQPAVIPEGVDRPQGRVLSANEREPTILFVSTLFDYKGWKDLIRAVALLPRSFPWRVRVLGRDPGGARESIRELVTRHSLQDRVDVVGQVPPEVVMEELRRSRLLVYPSRLESFGLPPIEAMAVGTPVVTSDCASLPEVVGAGGIVLDTTDPRALASTVQELLVDDAVFDTWSTAGQRRAEQFNWRDVGARFLALADHVGGRR